MGTASVRSRLGSVEDRAADAATAAAAVGEEGGRREGNGDRYGSKWRTGRSRYGVWKGLPTKEARPGAVYRDRSVVENTWGGGEATDRRGGGGRGQRGQRGGEGRLERGERAGRGYGQARGMVEGGSGGGRGAAARDTVGAKVRRGGPQPATTASTSNRGARPWLAGVKFRRKGRSEGTEEG